MSGSPTDLVRGLGLMVDGPVRWGERVGAGGPGIYLVEWPGPADHAPIDHNLLRAWLERVPTLRLDGAVPTPHELADRLASFWLPGETLVYVGSSVRSIRNRVAAQAATALGDRRPFAGGYWLKTLRGLEQARVWWAATDAPEEYADALLDAFAARLGRPAVLPFANLDASGARRREHGISGALLADPAGGTPSGVGPTSAVRSSAGDRSPATARSGSAGRARPGPRRPASAGVPLSGPNPPGRPTRRSRSKPAPNRAAEPAYLSAEGLERIRAELADLRDVQRPQVIARVRSARELGDLKENAEYHAAREEQSFLEGRVLQLQDLVDRAVLVGGGEADGRVALGSTVEVAAEEDPEAEPLTLTIVGTAEADSRAGRVSDRSPMGAALLGSRAGAVVTVRTPGGERRYTIRSVR